MVCWQSTERSYTRLNRQPCAAGRYPRQREYPHPPPPSKNNTNRTIKIVSMSYLRCRGLPLKIIHPDALFSPTCDIIMSEKQAAVCPIVTRCSCNCAHPDRKSTRLNSSHLV